MKAITQDRYGGPEVLELTDVDTPVAGPDEVLVKIRAASINAREWHLMRGDPYIARIMDRKTFGRAGPNVKIRGTDFAGVVEAVGDNVTRLRPGDQVFGEFDGAFAEYVSAPESVVDLKPANLGFEQAAAVPLAGNTALVGIRDVARVQPGQKMLINGASGGVGTFAVQIAKAYDAYVTAVCSTRNADLVTSLGADEIVDYTRTDFAHRPDRYDLVLDLVGNRSLRDLRRVLTPTGTLILSGGGVSRGGSFFGPMGLMMQGQAMSRFVRHRISMLVPEPGHANLAALRELIEQGKVTPAIDRTYPLHEVPDAIRYMEVEHARAKVAITV